MDTDTICASAEPNRTPYREALASLVEHHGSAARALEALPAHMGVDGETALAGLAEAFRMTPIGMREMHRLEPDFEIMPFIEAASRLAICFRDGEAGSERLLFVIADPLDARTRGCVDQRMRARPRVPYRWALASVGDLNAYLAAREKDVRAMDTVALGETAKHASDTAALALTLQGISHDDSPVVRLLNSTIYDALKMQASDIHLECRGNGLVIKYRIDGVLSVISRMEGRELADQVLSRLKVISELDIAERRVPQDGRFKAQFAAREIDFRVSIMPNLFGEDAVLRILDRYQLSQAAGGLTLEALGFQAADMTFMRTVAAMPYGMLLVTGPTGSGKTTTLYAILTEINDGLEKTVTIEDPVEYQLGDILQIPVNEAKGLTFARGLRSILRHDPDRIMVGEIRDTETAQIAVQAALTGHQVFTTVHANNVFDVIGRFTNMGVDSYSFVSALNGVIAQRLLRQCCGECALEETIAPELLARSGIDPGTAHEYRFRRGIGCAACRGTGYRGRRAIAEALRMNDELRQLLSERAPLGQIKSAALRCGMTTLRRAAVKLLAAGETTLEEINRVTIVD
ncbi:general secretion pathway protein E [Trinickia symbiotica]|uniref:Type II/IV secretion system protein n=1 Tax=Trinickia symbiotica TaxID=863227 RepID=A0A2N7X299_9BURK|nr:GspE/PulE family protein [Trinickia symbiotica]PMS35605.1 type II/IV secretion system protein [Trinickia symbiotica]PPK47669.1 general secretion pathway protein E [Trinickia symbiotica]